MKGQRQARGVVESYPHIAFAIFLFGMAVWYAYTGEARFDIGGDELSDRHRIHVNAHGLDAIAIGGVFVAVGLLCLAQGLRGRPRVVLVCAGLIVLAAAMLYGLAQASSAVASLFT